jgi:hypothetical protein
MNSNGLKIWFGRHVQPVVDNARRRLVTKLLMNLGNNKGWKNSRKSM